MLPGGIVHSRREDNGTGGIVPQVTTIVVILVRAHSYSYELCDYNHYFSRYLGV